MIARKHLLVLLVPSFNWRQDNAIHLRPQNRNNVHLDTAPKRTPARVWSSAFRRSRWRCSSDHVNAGLQTGQFQDAPAEIRREDYGAASLHGTRKAGLRSGAKFIFLGIRGVGDRRSVSPNLLGGSPPIRPDYSGKSGCVTPAVPLCGTGHRTIPAPGCAG